MPMRVTEHPVRRAVSVCISEERSPLYRPWLFPGLELVAVNLPVTDTYLAEWSVPYVDSMILKGRFSLKVPVFAAGESLSRTAP